MYKYLIFGLIGMISLFVIKKIINRIERSFIFIPEPLEKDKSFNLSYHEKKLEKLVGHNVHLSEHNIKTKSGEKINLIYYFNPNTINHIIYSHGNCGNLDTRISLIYKFAHIASFVIYDYRGFGKSTGTPDEKGVYNDIYTVWKYLIKKDVKPNNIILYGNSLGSSISAWLGYYLCKQVEDLPKGIIMQSGFSSIKDIAYDYFPPLTIIFIQSEFNSKKYIKNIGNKIPILISHSIDDEIINIHHQDNLIKKNPFTTVVTMRGTHNDLILDKRYVKKIEKFVNG